EVQHRAKAKRMITHRIFRIVLQRPGFRITSLEQVAGFGTCNQTSQSRRAGSEQVRLARLRFRKQRERPDVSGANLISEVRGWRRSPSHDIKIYRELLQGLRSNEAIGITEIGTVQGLAAKVVNNVHRILGIQIPVNPARKALAIVVLRLVEEIAGGDALIADRCRIPSRYVRQKSTRDN